MKEAPQVGFAKIIWKALGLPAAFCLLKRAQEAKGPAVSRATRPFYSDAAHLPDQLPYNWAEVRAYQAVGLWAHPQRGGAAFTENLC